ncbi:MAG TPA: lipoyl(octanoyl) transferase LipB [Candidatus Krumholzibacteria bacterium]|nr:lipoyl(octanoyl) transferase LipB [Candidatus Krumholzibacteria bacterium]
MDSIATETAPLCEAELLGVVPYADALEMQAQRVALRADGGCADRLWLLEHPHVLTLGRNAHETHVLADRARLAALGVEIHECGRGGDVTYHGPGQLVAYPIVDLAPDRCDLHRYVRDLEQVLLRVLAAWGIRGHLVPGRTGVWVERPGAPPAKIAAIGVRVSRWITSHGIALNVRTDLRYFDLIVPCGLAGSAVTSMAELLPDPPTVAQVAERFAQEFGVVFARRVQFR